MKPMLAFGAARTRGVALLTAVLLLLVLFGITGAVLMVSVSEGKAVTDSSQYSSAFFAAESGLQASKWKMIETGVPLKDGAGNTTGSVGSGAYSVTSKDLGDGVFELTSTGSQSGKGVTLREYVEVTKVTRFPYGAMSFFGLTDKEKIKIKKHAGLIIDGDDFPAIVTTDLSFYQKLGKEFSTAIVKKEMPNINVSGYPMSTFEYQEKKGGRWDAELPFQYVDGLVDKLNNVDDLYYELVNSVNSSIIPSATKVNDTGLHKGGIAGGPFSFGTAATPAVVYLDGDVQLNKGEVLTGYGTLVISHKLTVEKGASLNWNGNVVITGDEKKKHSGDVTINDGAMSVTGNVVLLGEGSQDTKLSIKHDATVKVEGSVFVGTDTDDKKMTKAKLDVDGTMSVDGLVTLLGAKVDINFKNDSNFNMTGMFQAAFPDGPKKEKLKLTFDGNVEMHKDDAGIQKGIDALMDLGGTMKLTKLDVLVKDGVQRLVWLLVSYN